MALVWSDKRYATGFADVDEQHRQMFGRANELLAALESGEPDEKISARLDDLGDHAARHFECEEGHMERLQCPVRVTNRCAHEWFQQDFAVLRQLFDEQGNTPRFVSEVEEKVCGWLHRHLLAIDLVLKRFAN
jgi:hemerythrin